MTPTKLEWTIEILENSGAWRNLEDGPFATKELANAYPFAQALNVEKRVLPTVKLYKGFQILLDLGYFAWNVPTLNCFGATLEGAKRVIDDHWNSKPEVKHDGRPLDEGYEALM
jgi:hypothetical protein